MTDMHSLEAPAQSLVTTSTRARGQAVSDAALEVRYVEPEAFDALAAEYGDVVQEQTAVFVRSRWGEERLETVLIERAGQTLGAAAVVLVRAPVIDRGVAIVKWGPLWRRPGGSQDPAVLEACLAALKQEYAARRGFYLTVMPHADPDMPDMAVGLLRKLGFHEGDASPAPERYLVNVAIGPDELRKSLGQKWRYNLKKAQRNDFEIEQVDAQDGLARFMALYDKMMARKQFKDTSAVYTLPDIVDVDVAALKPMIVMMRHDGTDTAGAVIGTSGQRAAYLYGATDDRALPLKAGYALQWWIAERLCAMPEPRWYDLGGDDRDKGLHQFKKGFVGKEGRIEMTPAAHNVCTSALSGLVGWSAYRLRALKWRLAGVMHSVRSR